MQVLVADDDAGTRALLARHLRKMGHQVIEADDGAEVVKLHDERRLPDLVLIDREMPELGGLEAIASIAKGKSPHRPYFILVTSRAHRDDVIFALRHGIDDFIAKPFSYADIAARVQVAETAIRDWPTSVAATPETKSSIAGRNCLRRCKQTDLGGLIAISRGHAGVLYQETMDDPILDKRVGREVRIVVAAINRMDELAFEHEAMSSKDVIGLTEAVRIATRDFQSMSHPAALLLSVQVQGSRTVALPPPSCVGFILGALEVFSKSLMLTEIGQFFVRANGLEGGLEVEISAHTEADATEHDWSRAAAYLAKQMCTDYDYLSAELTAAHGWLTTAYDASSLRLILTFPSA